MDPCFLLWGRSLHYWVRTSEIVSFFCVTASSKPDTEIGNKLHFHFQFFILLLGLFDKTVLIIYIFTKTIYKTWLFHFISFYCSRKQKGDKIVD